MEPKKWKKPKFHKPGSKLNILNVRASDDEKKAMKQKAVEAGVTFSELVLKLVLGVKPRKVKPTPERQALLEMRGDLARLLSQVTTIAKALDAGQTIHSDVLPMIGKDIRTLADRINGELK